MIRMTAMVVCVSACALLLSAGCRKNSAQIADQVKSEMQQELTKKPGLKNLVVESVRLVKKSEEDFSGVAVGSINGEYVKFDVTCKYDGTSILWDADLSEGSLEELRRYMENLPLSGGSATDFRPVFEHVDRLVKEGSFANLRGLLYFTDGMGIYPERRPDYEVAFILLEEPPLSVKMPPWAIRIMPELPWRKPRESFDEFWQEEVLQELPEL